MNDNPEEIPAQIQEQADQALLEALLLRLGGGEAEANEARLRRLLAALPGARSARPPTRMRGWQVAAVLLALLVGWLLWPLGDPAAAVLLAAREAAAEVRDRAYTIDIVQPADSLQVELWVRGARACVLRTPRLVLGWDGERGWFVPPLGPVLVNDRPVLVEAWVERSGLPLPFLELDAVLARLERYYDLERLADGPEGRPRLRGRRRAAHGPGPHQVWLEARPGGALQRLELDWDAREPGPFEVRRIVFRLAHERPQADAWYGHAAHHAPGRPLLELGRP